MRPVNLIPQGQRRREDLGGKGAYVIVGFLAVLLVMVVAYVLVSNTVTQRTNDAASSKAKADRLEAQAAAATSFTNFTDIAQTRRQSVASVARTRFDWERFMRELSLIMPTGSWLQSTDASVTGELEDATNSTSGSGSGTPMANLVGCTPHQSDVARMMVRLRQLYRVTDVALNESTQEQADQPATVDSCGSYYKFDLTLSFAALPPSTEAPRGSAKVPAALGGGS
jgi:Tfp pilus assembly protein PilN